MPLSAIFSAIMLHSVAFCRILSHSVAFCRILLHSVAPSLPLHTCQRDHISCVCGTLVFASATLSLSPSLCRAHFPCVFSHFPCIFSPFSFEWTMQAFSRLLNTLGSSTQCRHSLGSSTLHIAFFYHIAIFHVYTYCYLSCVYIYIYMYMDIYICKYICIYMYIYIYEFICICRIYTSSSFGFLRILRKPRSHLNPCIPTLYMYTYMHTSIDVCTHTYPHTLS